MWLKSKYSNCISNRIILLSFKLSKFDWKRLAASWLLGFVHAQTRSSNDQKINKQLKPSFGPLIVFTIENQTSYYQMWGCFNIPLYWISKIQEQYIKTKILYTPSPVVANQSIQVYCLQWWSTQVAMEIFTR